MTSIQYKPVDRSAVARLAWIAADRDTLMLLRRSILQIAIERRHRVLAMAPNLTPHDRLSLLAVGIESETLSMPPAGLRPFAILSARRSLSKTLHEWRANTVVVEGAPIIDLATRAAAQAGCSALYPIIPPLGEQASRRLSPLAINRVLRNAVGIFASTDDDKRIVRAATLGVLPCCSLDTYACPAAPLPSLDKGFVVLAIGREGSENQASDAFCKAVQLLEKRPNRSRFQLGSFATQDTPAQTLERIEPVVIDTAEPDSLQAAIRSAHVVVVLHQGPRHSLAIVTALALGRPVLALDTAENRDLIDAGASGWLVAGSDPEELGMAMSAVLKRPDLLPGMARAARQKAERRLDSAFVARGMFATMGLADLRVRAA